MHEINASDQNGVDDARSLADLSASSPFNGRRRVIILNEFHQFTPQAQDALKDPMEKNPAIWILTTDRPDKVQPAIRSRAAAATFELRTLSEQQMVAFAEQALLEKNPDGNWKSDEAATFLFKHGVRSPREILGCLEQWFSGVPIEQTIHGAEHEPLYKNVAASVLSGNWSKTSELLLQIKTADYRGMVAMVSAYLASALLKEGFGPRADALATCLVGLGSNQFQDGVAYASTKALLYKCCKAIGGGK